MKRLFPGTLPRPVVLTLGGSVLLAGALSLAIRMVPTPVEARFGHVIHEAKSPYSEIRVREKGSQRALLFVDEHGQEACQSAVDLAAPGALALDYTRGMFAALAYGELPRRILIVGMGGGSMIRYLERTLPSSRIEAVEIDPEVVRIAKEYFGIRESDRVRIHPADAFDFFRGEQAPYDVVFMDAFLRAPVRSGINERAQRLKTTEFLARVKDRIAPGGVIAFNLVSWDPRTPGDLEAIAAIFPGLARYPVPGTGNLIVIAPREGPGPDSDRLTRRAKELDDTLPLGFSLSEVVRWQAE